MENDVSASVDTLIERYDFSELDRLSDVEINLLWCEVTSEMRLLHFDKFDEVELERLSGMKPENLQNLANLCKQVNDRKGSEGAGIETAGPGTSDNGQTESTEEEFNCPECHLAFKCVKAKELHEKFNLCSKQCSNCFRIFTRTSDVIRHLPHCVKSGEKTALAQAKGIIEANSPVDSANVGDVCEAFLRDKVVNNTTEPEPLPTIPLTPKESKSQKGNGKEKFQCEICSKTVSNIKNLRRHIAMGLQTGTPANHIRPFVTV